MPASGINLGVDTAEARGLFILTTDKSSLRYRQTINLHQPFAGMPFNSFYFDIKFGGLNSQPKMP